MSSWRAVVVTSRAARQAAAAVAVLSTVVPTTAATAPPTPATTTAATRTAPAGTAATTTPAAATPATTTPAAASPGTSSSAAPGGPPSAQPSATVSQRPQERRFTARATGPVPGAVLPGGTAALTVVVTPVAAPDRTDGLALIPASDSADAPVTAEASRGTDGPATAPASDGADAPVTVQAPFGTAFGPLTGPAGRTCRAPAPDRLDCRLPPAGGTAAWRLPVLVPAAAEPGTSITGGCVDLGGDGSCDVGPGGDHPLPDVLLGEPAPRPARAAATPAAAEAAPVQEKAEEKAAAEEKAPAREKAAARTDPATPATPPNDNSEIGGLAADNLPLADPAPATGPAADLPRTGQPVLALIALSVLLMVTGAMARVLAGTRRPGVIA